MDLSYEEKIVDAEYEISKIRLKIRAAQRMIDTYTKTMSPALDKYVFDKHSTSIEIYMLDIKQIQLEIDYINHKKQALLNMPTKN